MTPATPTLLYIDDDEGLARLVDRGLTRAGFKVVHAAGGEQGLARLALGGVDAVALDQYMPGLDGLETLERILAMPGAPPVVLMPKWQLERPMTKPNTTLFTRPLATSPKFSRPPVRPL